MTKGTEAASQLKAMSEEHGPRLLNTTRETIQTTRILLHHVTQPFLMILAQDLGMEEEFLRAMLIGFMLAYIYFKLWTTLGPE